MALDTVLFEHHAHVALEDRQAFGHVLRVFLRNLRGREPRDRGKTKTKESSPMHGTIVTGNAHKAMHQDTKKRRPLSRRVNGAVTFSFYARCDKPYN